MLGWLILHVSLITALLLHVLLWRLPLRLTLRHCLLRLAPSTVRLLRLRLLTILLATKHLHHAIKAINHDFSGLFVLPRLVLPLTSLQLSLNVNL